MVVVTTSFPRDEGDPSGHFVRSHARALVREGASVHVIAPFGAVTDAPIEAPPLVVHPAGGSSLFGFPGAIARAAEDPLRLVGALAFARGVRRRLAQLAPFDRVVAHWMVPCAWPLLAGVRGPLDVVVHGADVRVLLGAPALLRAAIVRSLVDRGARFQIVAAHLLDAMAAALPDLLAERLRASSRVEPAPIDVPDVASAAAALRASIGLRERGGEPLVVCVGRVVPDKRFDLVIAAAARIAPRVRIALVGDGPDRARIEALARAHDVALIATGRAARDEALAWIAAADVLVHPSAKEGAPSVVREARALGTPVVACAAGDVERWARDDTGIVIVEPSARAIAEALVRVTAARSG